MGRVWLSRTRPAHPFWGAYEGAWPGRSGRILSDSRRLPAASRLSLRYPGLTADVARGIGEFAFDEFASAWDVLAGITASQLEPERSARNCSPHEAQ